MSLTEKNIKLQMIESYLTEGFNSEQFNLLKQEMYRRGYRRTEVIEQIIAARLYGDVDGFYRRHPEMRVQHQN